MIRFCFYFVFFIHFFIKLLLWLNRTLSALWLVKNVNKKCYAPIKTLESSMHWREKNKSGGRFVKDNIFIANLPSFYVHFYYHNSRSFVDWIVGNQQKKKTKIWCRTNTVCIYKRKKKKEKLPPSVNNHHKDQTQNNWIIFATYHTIHSYVIRYKKAY